MVPLCVSPHSTMVNVSYLRILKSSGLCQYYLKYTPLSTSGHFSCQTQASGKHLSTLNPTHREDSRQCLKDSRFWPGFLKYEGLELFPEGSLIRTGSHPWINVILTFIFPLPKQISLFLGMKQDIAKNAPPHCNGYYHAWQWSLAGAQPVV